jgi:hypothetical protein
VKEMVIDVMMHSAAPEENAYHQIKICLKEMDDSELIQFDTTRFFIDHDVDNISPALEVEAVSACGGGESMDDSKDVFGLISYGDAFIV